MITAQDGRAEAWSDEQLSAHISNIKQNTQNTLEMASFEALVPTLITYFLQGCSSYPLQTVPPTGSKIFKHKSPRNTVIQTTTESAKRDLQG